MSIFDPAEEVLAKGVEDWVDFAEASGLITTWAERSHLDVTSETIRIISELLESSAITVGHVTKDQGFVGWSLSSADSITEIQKRWDELDRSPMPGDVCWLKNTVEGDHRGKLAIGEHGPDKRWIFESGLATAIAGATGLMTGRASVEDAEAGRADVDTGLVGGRSRPARWQGTGSNRTGDLPS